MRHLVEKYKEHLRLRDFAGGTISLYEKSLEGFIEYLAGERGVKRAQDVKKEDIREYQNKVHCMKSKRTGAPLSQAYKANLIIAVRSFFRYLVRSGEILYNPASDIEVPRSRKENLRDSLKERQMRKLITAAKDKNSVGIRDRAVLEVLYSTGIRNSELRDLKLMDVDLDNLELVIRRGKGGKGRVVPLGRIASSYLEEYLVRSRPILLNGKDTDQLFLSIGGKKMGMTVPIDICKKYAKKARIKKNVCTHMIRHSCATHLLRGGADIRYVQELLGHKDLDSTRIYAKVEISDLKKVHMKTHPRERI